MTSQQDENAASTSTKRPRLNGDNLTEPSDNSTRMDQTDEPEPEAVKEPPIEVNPLFDTCSVDLSFANKIVPSRQPETFTATPAPSSSQPEHGKLKALRGTKLDPLRSLLATQPATFYTTIIDLSRLMLDLSQK